MKHNALKDSEPRSDLIQFRCTPGQKAKLRYEAKACGISITDYILSKCGLYLTKHGD